MKLKNHQPAPHFDTRDVYGTQLNLQQLKGQRIYLAFERNAGCPVCNLRMHELLKQSEAFKSSGVKVIFVYETPSFQMKEYLGPNNYPFHFVADPENVLYNLYGVQRSFLKVLKSLFHGLMSRVASGNKLFIKPIKQDGHMDRIPAEFIISQAGKIEVARYGEYIGDHFPVDALFKAIRS